MIDILHFISSPLVWLQHEESTAWEVLNSLDDILRKEIAKLGNEYDFEDGMAIHRSAIIEQGVVLKGSIIVSPDCFLGAHAYLRGPVFLGKGVKIGPGCEIKQSVILENTAIAHLNYIGNSVIGSHVNFEAGAVCANHFNERQDKNIWVTCDDEIIDTKTDKFGALVGDGSKIGANAVLSPGTILKINRIVKRLELVEQMKEGHS